MNIPFSQYQLAHVRKAVFAGFGMAVTALVTALTNGVPLSAFGSWPALAGLLGAFIVGFGGVFNIPNKDYAMVEKVIEAINPVLGDKVAVILDPAMTAREPSDQAVVAADQSGPVPLVVPPDPPATPIDTPAPPAAPPVAGSPD